MHAENNLGQQWDRWSRCDFRFARVNLNEDFWNRRLKVEIYQDGRNAFTSDLNGYAEENEAIAELSRQVILQSDLTMSSKSF